MANQRKIENGIRQMAKSAIYKLGRVNFFFENCDPEREDALNILLPRGSVQSFDQATKIANLHLQNIRSLQNFIFKLHDDCLWLDAGCLIAPNGKTVLIVGRSGAGKSTTTMALALGHEWKVVAEDILLIDINKDLLITIGSPFSLKSGTFELLRDSIGRVPDPILDQEWSPLGTMVAPTEQSSHFDLSIVLHAAKPEKSGLRMDSIAPEAFVRKVMPLSNVLRLNGAADKLLEYVSFGSCIEIEAGTLRERLDAILQIVNQAK